MKASTPRGVDALAWNLANGGIRNEDTFRYRVAQMAFPTTGGEVEITMTAGIVDLGGGSTTVDAMIESADRALYRAKASGRNRIEIGIAST